MNPAKRLKLEAELAAAQLKCLELKAQLASSLGAAFDEIPKAGLLHGSAVIFTLTALGGRQIVSPVAIRDGLSKKTIEALQDDLRRSFELATLVSPAMALPLDQSKGK